MIKISEQGAASHLGAPRFRHIGGVVCLAYAPRGNKVASAGQDATIRIWDIASGRETGCLHGFGGPCCPRLVATPDGRRVISTGSDGVARVWDVATRKNTATLKGHTDSVFCVAFSPDGKILASGSQDRMIKLWDVAGD